MKIKVVGFDPSLKGWGIAVGTLDLDTGIMTDVVLSVVDSEPPKTKQVRQNSKDLYTATKLAEASLNAIKDAKAVFVEIPVGSQSARAMASYGVCVGVLGALNALNTSVIEVTATEVKVALTQNKNATKQEMIKAAVDLYPEANFPKHNGKITAKAEHVADALGAIHAGVNTPLFQNIMKILKGN